MGPQQHAPFLLMIICNPPVLSILLFVHPMLMLSIIDVLASIAVTQNPIWSNKISILLNDLVGEGMFKEKSILMNGSYLIGECLVNVYSCRDFQASCRFICICLLTGNLGYTILMFRFSGTASHFSIRVNNF